MSASSFMVYCGIKYVVPAEEEEAVEERADERMLAARKVGLNCYWGRFGEGADDYLLYVGTEVGIFGIENSSYRELDFREVDEIFQRTRKKISDAGLEGKCMLHLQFEPDM